MTKKKTQLPKAVLLAQREPLQHGRAQRGLFDIWSAGALGIAALVLMPIIAVVLMALAPAENIWPQLAATVLPRYLMNTVILMLGVGVLSVFFGAGTAWLVVMCRFPGARFFELALFFPLAVPAYIGAYSLVDFLQFAGPVQSGLRAVMGWQSARDYWFPEVRSLHMAVIVLASALYPYVYLLARAAFREQSANTYKVARALGKGPWAVFWHIGLPLARPAVAAGVALALMETAADYGTVAYFNVQTLTTGIFSVWLDKGNIGGAAQIALVILALILMLGGVERYGQRGARFFAQDRLAAPRVSRAQLSGFGRWAAFIFCLTPFAFGFVLPVLVMAWHSAAQPVSWPNAALVQAALHSLISGGGAAILTVLAALFLAYGARFLQHRVSRLVLPLTGLGYAVPGAVLALGILIPLAAFDHALADTAFALSGWDPGLIFTGSAAAVVFAYCVRFFGVAKNAVDSAFGRIAPNLPLAARTLGRAPAGVFRTVHMPLMRGSALSALLIVFVDCVKELPATLLLRPFNYNTLSTHLFELASLERLEQAAPAALLIILIGMSAVALLAHNSARQG